MRHVIDAIYNYCFYRRLRSDVGVREPPARPRVVRRSDRQFDLGFGVGHLFASPIRVRSPAPDSQHHPGCAVLPVSAGRFVLRQRRAFARGAYSKGSFTLRKYHWLGPL